MAMTLWRRRTAGTWCIAAAAVVLLATSSTVAGEKKGLKGRYLELESGVALASYRNALVVLEPAKITTDKEQAVDTESVRSSSDEMLRDTLEASGLFTDVVAELPLQIPEDRPLLRLSTKLTLQYGSQALRALVGGGAGKSKLHIRIDIADAKTGAHLGFYNGYGTGGGFGSISGGGIQRMARDDFEENYAKFRELLGEQMQ